MGWMLKYYRNPNLFLICVISSKERQKTPKGTAYVHFKACLHIFTNSFNPSRTVVSTSLLEKLQCALFHYQILQCPLFIITKVCSVRFFITNFSSVRFLSLQKFVVCAFSIQNLQCPLFIITKVCSVRFFITKICSVRFLSLQKFVVSAFCHYKSLQSAFLTCKFVGPGLCIGLGDMVEGFSFILGKAILCLHIESYYLKQVHGNVIEALT